MPYLLAILLLISPSIVLSETYLGAQITPSQKTLINKCYEKGTLELPDAVGGDLMIKGIINQNDKTYIIMTMANYVGKWIDYRPAYCDLRSDKEKLEAFTKQAEAKEKRDAFAKQAEANRLIAEEKEKIKAKEEKAKVKKEAALAKAKKDAQQIHLAKVIEANKKLFFECASRERMKFIPKYQEIILASRVEVKVHKIVLITNKVDEPKYVVLANYTYFDKKDRLLESKSHKVECKI